MSDRGSADAAGAAAAFLKILAHENRLLILCQLIGGECTVGEIEEALGLSQPIVSGQLMRLRAEGLVSARREGRNIFYSLGRPEVVAVVTVLQDTFCKPGEQLIP